MEDYSQLVLWLGVYVGEENIEEFEKLFKEKYDFRVKYHSEFELMNEYDTSCTLFYIHSEDIPKFSIFRVGSGDMKWFEDYVENNPSEISEEVWKLYDEYLNK